MPDFDLPSFSLGLDSDPEDGPGPDVAAEDSDLEDDPMGEDAPRLFRRLRRGVRLPDAGSKVEITISSSPDKDDDEIEEFSSPEELSRDDKPSGQLRCDSNGEKVPLRGLYVGSVPSSNRSTVTREEHPSNLSGKRLAVGMSSVSPLRKFHLVDSDTDSPTTSGSVNVDNGLFNLSSKVAKDANEQKASRKRKGESSCTPSTEDLWKNFSSVKGFGISTPALDKVCEEYYQNKSQKFHAPTSVGDDERKTLHTTMTQKIESCSQGYYELPPAHRYFFHNDPNIRNLVRRRLPHFSPIGGAYSLENKQSAGSLIDYMHQFGNGESSQSRKPSTAEQMTNSKKRTRARSRAAHSTAEESQAGWVDPKTSGGIPTNAGKKRVQVTSKSAGHWYTAPSGRKVYVTGDGKELTGQSAYRYYRKENGKAFKESKRKGNPKKKGKG